VAARIARDAYRDFGQDSGHKAGLNFGDCFAYALAKTAGEVFLDGDTHDGGLGMLCGVGERFGHDVVGGDLDRLGQPYLRVHLCQSGEQWRSGFPVSRYPSWVPMVKTEPRPTAMVRRDVRRSHGYGHAERNLALICRLEAGTRQLLASVTQPDPEQSAWLREASQDK
jgi:hypothetical protein